MIKILLKVESVFILIFSVFAYAKMNGYWLEFLLMFAAPDLAMLGYMRNAKIGAVVYNVIHTYALAILLILAGVLVPNELLQRLGVVLAAHIAMDRAFGFGLKKPTGFKDTHLGKIGK